MTARERQKRRRDYEKEQECVGRGLTHHLVFFCRREIKNKNVLQRRASQTDGL